MTEFVVVTVEVEQIDLSIRNTAEFSGRFPKSVSANQSSNFCFVARVPGGHSAVSIFTWPFGNAAFVHAGPATAPIATDAGPGLSWKSYISCSPFTSDGIRATKRLPVSNSVAPVQQAVHESQAPPSQQ